MCVRQWVRVAPEQSKVRWGLREARRSQKREKMLPFGCAREGDSGGTGSIGDTGHKVDVELDLELKGSEVMGLAEALGFRVRCQARYACFVSV